MDLERFNGKTIFITGACGLIGRALTETLSKKCGARVIASVRSEEKARGMFANLPQDRIIYHIGDVRELEAVDLGVDYVIHCASMTSSKAFIERPVDVIDSAVFGTKNVLEFSRANRVEGVVYLSTMEVYGAPHTDDKIYETSPSELNTADVRSSYPESKRLCESMCAAYHSQYGLPVNAIRLTQTFGAGVDYNDGRVFAEFARCVIEGRDIILKTKGETCRNYLFVDDAVNAILTVLARGVRGEIYNAANENTYCSIYDMACLVAEFGNGKTHVRIEESDISRYGYAPTLKMNLSAEKLQGLGWRAETDLKTMYAVLIEYMRQHKNNA